MITYVQKSRSIAVLISPVKAPFSSQYTSCAPTLSVVPSRFRRQRAGKRRAGRAPSRRSMMQSRSASLMPSGELARLQRWCSSSSCRRRSGFVASLGSELHEAAGVGHRERQRLLGREDAKHTVAAAVLVERIDLVDGAELRTRGGTAPGASEWAAIWAGVEWSPATIITSAPRSRSAGTSLSNSCRASTLARSRRLRRRHRPS